MESSSVKSTVPSTEPKNVTSKKSGKVGKSAQIVGSEPVATPSKEDTIDFSSKLPSFTNEAERTVFNQMLSNKAFVGFARSSIHLDSRITWGDVNNREHKPAHLAALHKAFLQEGVMKSDMEKSMPIILPQDWVATSFSKLAKVVEPVFKDLPELKLSKNGEAALGD